MICEVSYSTQAPANSTIAPENQMPSLKPNTTPAKMMPIATRPAIFKKPPRKEKSYLLVKAVKVRPATRARVAIDAAWMEPGATMLAMASIGAKISDSANTKPPSARY